MNKIKKILMTTTLLTGTLFANGCSSDIKFNQEDLDKVLVETREYLEAQNNYSTEFAKNYLINNLVNGIEKMTKENLNTRNVLEETTYDYFGNKLSNSVGEFKNYYDSESNTKKMYLNITTSEGKNQMNSYIFVKTEKENSNLKYNVTAYNVEDKTYTKSTLNASGGVSPAAEVGGEMVGETVTSSVIDDMIKGMADINMTWYKQLYNMVLSDDKVIVTMDKIDQNTNQFILIANTEEEGNEFVKITFKDQLITKIEQITIYDTIKNQEKGDYLNKETCVTTIEYGISNFDVPEINSYTEAN